jgi:hypothetical protein
VVHRVSSDCNQDVSDFSYLHPGYDLDVETGNDCETSLELH